MFYSLISSYQSFTSVLIYYYIASTPPLSPSSGFNYRWTIERFTILPRYMFNNRVWSFIHVQYGTSKRLRNDRQWVECQTYLVFVTVYFGRLEDRNAPLTPPPWKTPRHQCFLSRLHFAVHHQPISASSLDLRRGRENPRGKGVTIGVREGVAGSRKLPYRLLWSRNHQPDRTHIHQPVYLMLSIEIYLYSPTTTVWRPQLIWPVWLWIRQSQHFRVRSWQERWRHTTCSSLASYTAHMPWEAGP